jgi:hypothetical protein
MDYNEYERAKQEAESHKYSNKVFLILELESGKYALFSNSRKLYGIYEDWFDLGDVTHSQDFLKWREQQDYFEPPSMKYEDILEVKVDVGDLGL